jgi:lysozyme
MAQFSPDEAQAIINEYNQKLKDKQPISEDLAKAMKDAATGIKDYTDNLKASLDKVSNAALKMGKSLVQGESGLSVYNDTIEAGGQAMGAWAQKIPIVGGALNSAAKAASKAIVLINKQADTLFQNYQDISRSGLVTGMGDTFKNLQSAGYTVAEIKDYGTLLKQNATTLATFGGTAAQGAQTFAEVAQSIQNSDLQTNFMNMGMTVGDINSGVANYIKIQQLSGSTRTESNTELKESAQEFIMQQDRLTKLTGLNAAQQNKVMEHALAMEQFNAKQQELQQKADAGDEAAKAEIARNKEILTFTASKFGQATADDAAQFLAGAVNSPGYQRFQRALPQAAKSITDGVKNTGQIQQQLIEGAKKTATEQSTLGTVGQFSKVFGSMSEFTKAASSSVNNVTKSNAEITEQQKGQIDATDSSVGSSVKLRQNQRDTTQSLDKLTNVGVTPVAKTFSALTSVAQQLASVGGQIAGKEGQVGGGTTLLNKVGIGTAPSAAAPIPTTTTPTAPPSTAAPIPTAPAPPPTAPPSTAAPIPTTTGTPGAEKISPIVEKIKNEVSSAPAKGAASLVAGMDAVKQMIMRHEGVRTRPYRDSLGLWTVGVGHLIGDGKSLPADMNREFSQKEVMDMFEKDFAHHYGIAQQTPGWDKANETGKGAMIDLAFNMGRWWSKFPNTAKALMAGDFSSAAAGLRDSKWFTQVGNRGSVITSMIAQGGGGSGKMQSAATGGVLSGPKSGYTAMLHGNEAVVPLPDGRTIPVAGMGGSDNSFENNKIISMKIAKLDQLISGMIKNNNLSSKILQRQS